VQAIPDESEDLRRGLAFAGKFQEGFLRFSFIVRLDEDIHPLTDIRDMGRRLEGREAELLFRLFCLPCLEKEDAHTKPEVGRRGLEVPCPEKGSLCGFYSGKGDLQAGAHNPVFGKPGARRDAVLENYQSLP
jgi:hypothetical protein